MVSAFLRFNSKLTQSLNLYSSLPTNSYCYFYRDAHHPFECLMRTKRPLMVITALAAAQLHIAASYAETAPYAVKWYFDDLVEVKRLDFIVMADQLEIHNVIVNKGNCPIATTMNGAVELSVNDAVLALGEALAGQDIEPLEQTNDPMAGFPLNGVFGEALSVYVPMSCNILRVEITTPEGNWTSTFKY